MASYGISRPSRGKAAVLVATLVVMLAAGTTVEAGVTIRAMAVEAKDVVMGEAAVVVARPALPMPRLRQPATPRPTAPWPDYASCGPGGRTG